MSDDFDRPGAGPGEWIVALLATAFVLALSSFAYRQAEAREGDARAFVGILADGHKVDIQAIYGSFAREVAEGGGLLVHNHQTSEPHEPRMARPWDFAVGLLARAAGTVGPDADLLFHLDRLLAVPLCAVGFTLLLGELLRSRTARRLAFLAAFLGGNLYWLVPVLGRDSAFAERFATWLAEGLGWNSSGLGFTYPALLLGAPHLVLEPAFLAAALGLALRAERTGSIASALGAGIALALQCGVRPYSGPVTLLCMAALFGPELLRPRASGRWRSAAQLALATLPATALLLHYRSVLAGDSVFASLNVVHPAPPLVEQALFMGLPVLGVVALPILLVRRRRAGLGRAAATRVLWTWAIANLAIVEAPLDWISWPVEAMLPLPLLCVCVLALAAESLPRATLLRWGTLLVLVHAIPTLCYGLEVWRKLEDPASSYWLPAEEAAVLSRLEATRPAGGFVADRAEPVLVSSSELGRLVPWLAGVRVFLGHPDHTRDAPRKQAAVRELATSGEPYDAIVGLGATHLLWGPRERALGRRGIWSPAEDDRFELEHADGRVALYRLRAP